ncbi:uncharacterized protein C19orf18 homolog isoform X1 [Mustela erminea]|uniref:uncharacterized protein C19orf18 homolog isoform X1 n=1 Tax=Mustela erminea TaxID=36723 RepID=UPI001386EEFF|nr:uncharacterized protein C19orf18 homolog isoform X1 [Mustela erminea]
MDKVQSSFTFLVLFLIECPLLLCLPYGGYKQSQTSTNVTKQEGVFSRLRAPRPIMPKQFTGRNGRGWPQPVHHRPSPPTGTGTGSGRGESRPPDLSKSSRNLRAHPTPASAETWNAALISHRPALVQVIIIACVAFTIALVFGIAISYVIYRLVHAEERQQLVWLYNNVSVPFLGGDEDDDNVGEDSESESLDESTYLLPENEEELEKFIYSVIRSKRRKHMENKRLRKEQNLLKGTKMGNSMPGIFSEDL